MLTPVSSGMAGLTAAAEGEHMTVYWILQWRERVMVVRTPGKKVK